MASEALHAVRDGQRLDQRAWIGPASYVLRFQEGSPFYIGVRIRNTGKTPALRANAVIDYTEGVGQFTKQGMVFRHKTLAIGTVHPGADYTLNMFGTLPLTAHDLAALRAGHHTIWAYGRIEYSDIFGSAHRSWFCVELDRKLTEAASCDCCNDAD